MPRISLLLTALIACVTSAACTTPPPPASTSTLLLDAANVSVQPWGSSFEIQGLATTPDDPRPRTLVSALWRECVDGEAQLAIQGRDKQRAVRGGPNAADKLFTELCRLGRPKLDAAEKQRYGKTY